MNPSPDQERICREYGAELVPSPSHMKIGIAKNVRDRLLPLNGLRHPPAGDTTGWYIWAGETLSPDDDFFVPLHVAHLELWCPQAIQFLGLPPGWRFIAAPGHEDVWFDQDLLNYR